MPDRTDTHVLKLEAETTFNVENAAPAPISILQWDLDPAGLKRAVIENQGTSPDTGTFVPGAGLQYESEVPFSTYAESLATPAGDAITPTIPVFADLLGATLGEAPYQSTGSKVATASAPTVTQVEEDVPGAHGGDQLVGFGFADGRVEVRPVGVYLLGVMTLLMELTAAPDDTLASEDTIYGSVLVDEIEEVNHTIQGQIVGENTAQNWKIRGCVNNLTWEEATEGESQTLSHTLNVASFDPNVAGLVQDSPSVQRPLVNAGSEYLLARYGETVAVPLCLARVQLETGREYKQVPCGHDNLDGIQGWILTGPPSYTFTVHVFDDQALPTGGTTTTWYDVFGSDDETENQFHLLINSGQQIPGRVFSIYGRKLYLAMDPDPVSIDGLGAFKLTFRPVVDSTIDHKITMALT